MDFYSLFPELRPQRSNIEKAISAVVGCHSAGGKIFLAGNGGSSSDCAHIVGELVKTFLRPRPVPSDFAERLAGQSSDDDLARSLCGGIAAFDLTAQNAFISACSNDISAENVYAQQLYVYGRPNDVFIGISASGSSDNIVRAFRVARAAGITGILLTGRDGGKCSALADIAVCVPASETYRIQEYHLPIYHYICAECERLIFGGNADEENR